MRDAVVNIGPDHDFTVRNIMDITGLSNSSVNELLHELKDQNIVKLLDRKAGNAFLFQYNNEFPPAPRSHPHEPTPESLAIGAPLAGSPVSANGAIRVSDKTIQLCIDQALLQNWEVTWKDGNHLKFKSPTGRTVGVNAKPPSPQVAEVIKRDLKRSGLRV